MSEAIFPLLGTALVVLVVLPGSALVTKLLLLLSERHTSGGPLHGLTPRYVLLLASSALPLLWFLSAGLHQLESPSIALACLLDHQTAALCFEPGLFAVALGLTALVLALPALSLGRRYPEDDSAAAASLRARLHRLLNTHAEIAELRGRLRVTSAPGFALGTCGLWRPQVVVAVAFAARLRDTELASALGHELQHVRALDPLRYLLLRVALAVNPIGRRLLEPHADAWRAAREAHCDREAVLAGARPLCLAEALVTAARPLPVDVVALGARDTALLRLRVQMLVAFSEAPPRRCCQRGPSSIPLALVLLLAALLLPHQAGTAALDALHQGAEYPFIYFYP